MRVFEADNANEMATLVYPALAAEGIKASSRNGPVLKFPTPVTFVYNSPYKRVVISPIRDCNPFFHLMEGVMMLANHNCVECMSKFTGNMRQYSDNGSTFNAFYGTRMHEKGQFVRVAEMLRRDPSTRQAVVQLWDPKDLTKDTKDKACNMSMVFAATNKGLTMTVFNRSNDLIYGGVTGANVVHFSMIHEAMSSMINYYQGPMYHVVNDAHVYIDNPHWPDVVNMTETDIKGLHIPMEAGTMIDAVDFCLMMHDKHEQKPYNTNFFEHVVQPMYDAFINRREDTSPILKVQDTAWMQAGIQWLRRRKYEV